MTSSHEISVLLSPVVAHELARQEVVADLEQLQALGASTGLTIPSSPRILLYNKERENYRDALLPVEHPGGVPEEDTVRQGLRYLVQEVRHDIHAGIPSGRLDEKVIAEGVIKGLLSRKAMRESIAGGGTPIVTALGAAATQDLWEGVGDLAYTSGVALLLGLGVSIATAAHMKKASRFEKLKPHAIGFSPVRITRPE